MGSYVPARIVGNLIYVSGQLPVEDGKLKYEGKLGFDLDVYEGYKASKLAAINCLSVIKSEIGSLLMLDSIVKVTGYISSAPGFSQQANVLNGASELFVNVFGKNGKHARVAVGVNELPLNSPVEIEVIAKISSEYSF